jgi:hypothetical protein
MRKSFLIICGLVLAVCVWLLLHRRAEAPVSTGTPTMSAAATNQNPATTSEPVMPATVQNAPAHAAATSHTSATNAPNAVLPTAAELLQKPIDFYGKVVDENTNPVEGASIEFRWDDLTAKDWTRTATATSDAAGLFSLHGGRGATLTVSVSKAGYYTSPKNTDSFQYAFPNSNQAYSADQWNPAVFQLQQKGQGAELVTSENGMRPDLPVLVPINGNSVSVDLLNKKAGASGDLELSQIKPDRSHWQQATNWSFHMDIPSGGFIGQDDAFPFEAPASGYQSTIDLNFVKDEPDWTTHIATNYYIIFGQPQKYGWLHVEANITQQTVFLKYAINPTGSRNLEPK